LLARSSLLALSAFALSPMPCAAFSAKDVRSILTYDEMMTRLQRIATRGQDARLSEAPYRAKTTGRALPVITVGNGPRTILITAMQHANEYRVSDAAVDVAEKLSRRRNAWMRSALTVVIMPRVNVDGFDNTLPGEPWRGLPWRFNVDATAVGFTGPNAANLAQVLYPFAITGVGYNVNRYHPVGLTEDPGAPTQPNPVPETLAVRHVFDQVQPSMMLDLHEEPSAAGNVEGRPVDVALAWTAPSLGVAPDVLAQEKRIAYAALLANPTKRTGRYSFIPTDAAGQAHNRYGLLGVPSLLVEFRGLDCWIEADSGISTCTAGGDPSNRAAERLVRKTVLSVLESAADGSVDLIDPALADQYILPYQTTFPVGTRDSH
jgi:predicted deacylase